jgi:hypothetical protein
MQSLILETLGTSPRAPGEKPCGQGRVKAPSCTTGGLSLRRRAHRW